MSQANDGESFWHVLTEYCRIAGLESPSESSLMARPFHAARYRFGRCVDTIIGAIEQALEGGATRLDVGHFAEFWGIQEGCFLDQNVFTGPDWQSIDPDIDEQEEMPRARRKRRRQ